MILGFLNDVRACELVIVMILKYLYLNEIQLLIFISIRYICCFMMIDFVVKKNEYF